MLSALYRPADGRLRSPGYYQYYAASVYADGSLNGSYVDNVLVAVRPALWIDLKSDLF